MVEVKNLTKFYGSIKAVDDISFTVETGEVLGFLGPNGAGKSTTMNMITGYLSSTAVLLPLTDAKFLTIRFTQSQKSVIFPKFRLCTLI